MQREITKNLTISVDYSGSQSHFISGAGNIRGYYAGQLDPKYLVLGANLTKPATAANIAAAQAAIRSHPPRPYPSTPPWPRVNTNATIAHMLTWKPQYAGTTDTWGNYVANGNYNSFQVSLAQRASHGLSFNVNYTYSQNIDDAGTQRSGYDYPRLRHRRRHQLPQEPHRPLHLHQRPAAEPQHLRRLHQPVREGQLWRKPPSSPAPSSAAGRRP